MLHPVAVGDLILMRSPGGVRAVHVKTGQVVWRYPPESRAQMGEPAFDQLIWREAAFGRVSTDGRLAFLVEGSYAIPSTGQPGYAQVMWRGPFMGGGMGGFPGGGAFFGGKMAMMAVGADEGGELSFQDLTNSNQLTAIDVFGEGKLRWSVGADSPHEPRLVGAFFLGPPTAVGDQLFVLAEIKNSICLAVLEKHSGRLNWLQKLADVEHSIAQDPFRRMAGASPVVVSGIAICPTSGGGMVAVDTARRSLLWVFQHPRKDATLYNPEQGRVPTLGQGGRWADALPMVADGRVLLTPMEADDMYCLELRTGKRLWSSPRMNALYIGCIHNGKVLLVENRFIRAANLSDGKPAWRSSLQLPANCRPSGRGVHSGDSYYLPLTDVSGGYSAGGEIVQIELNKGAIIERAKSQREFVPGNLIFHNGVFVSQGVQYLEIFDELGKLREQVEQRLLSNPKDAEALARLGDIKRHSGKLPEAIEHLRLAYQLRPSSDRIKSSYAAILLEGIAAKLPNNAELSAELERLVR
jgi:outer membrane protein assembly factor BamB